MGAMLLGLGRWDEARALFRRRLAVNPDQWADWVGLLSATLEQQQQQQAVPATDPEVQAAQALALELQAEHPAFRGPYLAEMELLLRLARPGTAASAASAAAEGLQLDAPPPPTTAAAAPQGETLGVRLGRLALAYLRRFGTKLCCFDDLLPYLTALAAGSSAHVAALVQELEALAAANSVVGRADEALQAEEERPAVVRRLQLCIRVHQLLRLLRTGPCGGAAQRQGGGRQEEVAALSAEYSRTLFVNEGAEGGQREVQQGDELLLLAAHALEDAALEAAGEGGEGGRKGALLARLEAAVLLEQGLRYSPYNYHFRLALLATYDRLAAGEPAIDHYNQLEVKQVQLDTLSWLLYPGCLRHGFYTEARVRSRHLLAMHAASAREAHDHVARALGYGTYAKALEIERFQRTRMDRSLQLALARCEAARLELLQRHHAPDAALTYLRELASGMLPESLAGEREEELGLLPSLSPSSSSPASSSSSLLSDNMDFLVVRDWRFRTRAQEEARRRARGERHVVRVRLWLVLQRLLLAALQGEGAQVRDRLPKVEGLLQALGYCCPAATNGMAAPPSASPEGQMHNGWMLVLRSLQALPPTLDAVASPGEDALVDAAVQEMERAGATVAAAEKALLGEEEGRTLDRMLGGKCGLLDPDWLRGVSAFMAVAGAVACPVLLKLGAAALQTGGVGKRKGKKGGKGAGTAVEGESSNISSRSAVPERLMAAARGLLRGMERLLAGLEAALKAFDRAGSDAGPAEALAARELGERLWTFVGESDFAGLQAHVVDKVRSSHRISAERLREVVRAKREALASAGVV